MDSIITTVISFICSMIPIITVLIKLNTTITKLDLTMKNLINQMDESKNDRQAMHEQLNDHETRITVLERK